MLSWEGALACAVKCWAEVKSKSRVMKMVQGWYGLGGLIFFMLMLLQGICVLKG